MQQLRRPKVEPIMVDRYTMAFDCDHPTYTVRFLKVDMPPTVVASNNTLSSGCL